MTCDYSNVVQTPAHAPGLISRTEPRARTDGAQQQAAPIVLLGVPFDNVTTAGAIDLIEGMIASGRPHQLVTANVDFLVQAVKDVELRRILFDAHLVLCDGTPLLWASRWLGNSLPERVAGSDLVPLLIRVAAEKGYRIFFLGGAPDAAQDAVTKLQVQHPSLIIAGHYSPRFADLLNMDHAEIRRRIQLARPDILFVCFGCPKQEKWIAMEYRSLGVPVCIGVGGTIDFLAGRLARAPLWMRRTGTEWLFRLAQEPRRLFRRYARDLCYFGALVTAQWCRTRLRGRKRPANLRPVSLLREREYQEINCPEWLDAEAARQDIALWDRVLTEPGHILLNLGQVRFIDSTGLGLLIRLRKRADLRERHLILVAPSPAVNRLLELMGLRPFFVIADNMAQARDLLATAPLTRCGVVESAADEPNSILTWRGEVTAANAHEIWNLTVACMRSKTRRPARFSIDLAQVHFMDSTGVGLMVAAKKTAQQEALTLRFLHPQANVRNVLRLSQLEEYLLEDAPHKARSSSS